MSGSVKNWNLNSTLTVLGIVAPIVAGVFFLAPLNTLPADVKAMQDDVGEVKRTQAVQTEALRTLADVTKENKELRRDFERHAAQSDASNKRQDLELEQVKRSLERIHHQ